MSDLVINSVLRDVYEGWVLQGMPPSTRLLPFDLGESADRYVAALVAPAFGVWSPVAIDRLDLDMLQTNTRGLVALMERRLIQARQRHHLACAAARGGFY